VIAVEEIIGLEKAGSVEEAREAFHRANAAVEAVYAEKLAQIEAEARRERSRHFGAVGTVNEGMMADVGERTFTPPRLHRAVRDEPQA
jgi:hypothetical protein